MSSKEFEKSADNNPEEQQDMGDTIAQIADAPDRAVRNDDSIRIRPEAGAKLLQFLTQAGLIGGTVALATKEGPEFKLGAAALFACGALVMDLQNNGDNGRCVAAARRMFGSVPTAMKFLGVTACLALGGGAFYNMVRDGGVNNPKDHRWHIVWAHFAPCLGGRLLEDPRIKEWVNRKFGETIKLAYKDYDTTPESAAMAEARKKFLAAETTLIYKDLLLAWGGAHILAAGLSQDNVDLKMSLIGTSFALAPMVSAHNRLKPVSEGGDSENPDNRSTSRREFFPAFARLVYDPLRTGDHRTMLDNLWAIIGRGDRESSIRTK